MKKIDLVKENWSKEFRDVYVEDGNGQEGQVQHPIYGGRPTHCRSSLYTLTKILKPKSVLEIGSWNYQGSNYVAKALVELNLNSPVLSLDIRKGGYTGNECYPKYECITAGFWYPHHTTTDVWKYDCSDLICPEFKDLNDEEIFEKNLEIVNKWLSNKGLTGFDIVIIDGDHTTKGINFDWEYTKRFINQEGIVIVDDLYDSRHKMVRDYFDGIELEKYDWDDWNKEHPEYLISMGVIQL